MSGRLLGPLSGSPSGSQGAGDIGQALNRVRNIILAAALDCDCRARVEEALARLEQFERHRENRRRILMIRDRQCTIAALLELLPDLSALDARAPDGGVIEEASLLLADIASAANTGAQILNEMLNAEARYATPA
ncbi:hypothetical protein I6F11_10135 [Ensifer sp. NBAIM29]|nr:hypothetical protein [Ensifer sp. NBAIM29]